MGSPIRTFKKVESPSLANCFGQRPSRCGPIQAALPVASWPAGNLSGSRIVKQALRGQGVFEFLYAIMLNFCIFWSKLPPGRARWLFSRTKCGGLFKCYKCYKRLLGDSPSPKNPCSKRMPFIPQAKPEGFLA